MQNDTARRFLMAQNFYVIIVHNVSNISAYLISKHKRESYKYQIQQNSFNEIKVVLNLCEPYGRSAWYPGNSGYPQKVGINEFIIYCLCKLNVWYTAY